MSKTMSHQYAHVVCRSKTGELISCVAESPYPIETTHDAAIFEDETRTLLWHGMVDVDRVVLMPYYTSDAADFAEQQFSADFGIVEPNALWLALLKHVRRVGIAVGMTMLAACSDSMPTAPTFDTGACTGAIQGNTVVYVRRGESPVTVSQQGTSHALKTPTRTEYYRVLPDGLCGVSDQPQ